MADPILPCECIVRKIRQAIGSLRLNLHGAVVLTEAATGPFVATPVIAAMAGASRVYAMTRDSRYGTVADVRQQTLALAQVAGCADQVGIVTERTPEILGHADIVTNSGHLRPIDREMISWMKPTAVIPLMYEAWEFRPGDLDLHACRDHGIPVAGTNERHPAIGVFDYLGMMVIKQLLWSRVEVCGSQVLLLCDNAFAPYIEGALARCGAAVLLDGVGEPKAWTDHAPFDAVVVAMRPRPQDLVGGEGALVDVRALQQACPCGPVVQFLGDIDRRALRAAGLSYHPQHAPGKGQMGGLLSELGLAPVVRLQAGGLKVGELMWRARREGDLHHAIEIVTRTGYGEGVVNSDG